MDGDDAASSVMSSQRAVRVGTPVASSKKRQANNPVELEESVVKKPRHSTRRTLYYEAPTPALRKPDGKVVITKADIHVEGEATVKYLIHKLSADMHMLFTSK